jgi:Mg2+/Co2+ transporter CorB
MTGLTCTPSSVVIGRLRLMRLGIFFSTAATALATSSRRLQYVQHASKPSARSVVKLDINGQ